MKDSFFGTGLHTARHFKITKLDNKIVIIPKWRLFPEDTKLLQDVWRTFWNICMDKEIDNEQRM